MKKNILSALKHDLEFIPLVAYFLIYFLYLLFERIFELHDYAILLKPIILPIIAFLYIINKRSKRTFLNFFLLILLFVADNSSLLEIRSLYVYSMLLYVFSEGVLCYYSVLDLSALTHKVNLKKHMGITFLGLYVFYIVFVMFSCNLKDKTTEKHVVFTYMVVFLLLFVVSTFNFIVQKTKKTKYLFVTILCLFLSELFFSIDVYYNSHQLFKYLICLAELPVYYFLLKYLLERDQEFTE